MLDYGTLTEIQLDGLREVFNIGSGNSITSLSKLLNQKIDMSVPKVNIASMAQVLEEEAEKTVLAVLVKVTGETPGGILYVLEETVAKNIAEKLLGNREELFTEMGMSAMGEFGNIIASAYLNAMSDFTNIVMMATVPAVTYDNLSAILISTYMDSGQYDDYILEIETLFKGDGGSNIMGNFYFIPEPGSLEKILNKIGLS